MVRAVVAGVDGSPESGAAADWAAREAVLRGLPLRLVHAWDVLPGDARIPLDYDTQLTWARNRLNEARERVTAQHPDLELEAEEITDGAVPVLLRAAEGADLLVLGSRRLSGLVGFLLGSVGLAVVSRSPKPVVLVRAEDGGGTTPDAGRGTVVLGLDLEHGGDAPIEFALRAAADRGAALRVVHAWSPQLVYGYAAEPLDDGLRVEIEAERERSVTEAVRGWQSKFPEVEVDERLVAASPAQALLDAADGAGLLVVGRRQGRTVLGSRVGHVTHAVLHHAPCPVAVVPHD